MRRWRNQKKKRKKAGLEYEDRAGPWPTAHTRQSMSSLHKEAALQARFNLMTNYLYEMKAKYILNFPGHPSETNINTLPH